ncbi:MAG: DUF1847 domain-containing protein [Acidobacteriota bacterium]|nr:DUF1847 domain-containing protein [Acidobacteriota bacterium]
MSDTQEITTSSVKTCTECGVQNCFRLDKHFPDFCLGENLPQEDLKKIVTHYQEDEEDGRIARAAAEIEGLFYCKLTRVEEIVAFAHRIGAKKIGVASCLGLLDEARIFVRILKAQGLEPYSVICKVGSVDKTEIGVAEEMKVMPGSHEAICNPILQAHLLNEANTDLNVIVGLCVGHDSLFIKHSKAMVTTLITKDRVLGHNPAAALYMTKTFYKRLLEPKKA